MTTKQRAESIGATAPQDHRQESMVLMNQQEAAEFLGVPAATLKHWRHVNTGPKSVRLQLGGHQMSTSSIAPRRCGARNRQGKPCQKWPLRDATRCMFHGGKSPQAQQAAKRRRTQRLASIAVVKLGLRPEGYIEQAAAVYGFRPDDRRK